MKPGLNHINELQGENSLQTSHLLKQIIKKHYRIFIFIVLAPFINACNSRNQPGNPEVENIVLVQLPEPPVIDESTVNSIRNTAMGWYDTMLRSRGFNGGMIVAKKGRIIFESYNGNGHLNGKDLINESTPFHIASVSKTFTAMAVLKLQQDGRLNIDDLFNKYFPEFNYEGVTIRSMLNHRSGLPNYVHFLEEMGWDKNNFITNQGVLDFMIAHKNEMKNIAKPDTRFTYCNTNYALLALLIEKITGKSYAAYLSSTFFRPLQMKNSFVFSLSDTAKVIPSYDWRGNIIPYGFLDGVYGDKNIYSTPRDLLLWDRALNSGLMFSAKTLEEAYKPYSNEKAGIRNYGLGWRMNVYPSGEKLIYHNGWWHGNNASFVRLIADSATIIAVGNKFNRNIYHVRELAPLFGNYEGGGDEEESDNKKNDTTPAGNFNKTGH